MLKAFMTESEYRLIFSNRNSIIETIKTFRFGHFEMIYSVILEIFTVFSCSTYFSSPFFNKIYEVVIFMTDRLHKITAAIWKFVIDFVLLLGCNDPFFIIKFSTFCHLLYNFVGCCGMYVKSISQKSSKYFLQLWRFLISLGRTKVPMRQQIPSKPFHKIHILYWPIWILHNFWNTYSSFCNSKSFIYSL